MIPITRDKQVGFPKPLSFGVFKTFETNCMSCNVIVKIGESLQPLFFIQQLYLISFILAKEAAWGVGRKISM